MMRRRASILLEVLAAVALVVGMGLAILAAVDRATTALERSKAHEQAADLARSAMAALEAGIARPETLDGPVRGWPGVSAAPGPFLGVALDAGAVQGDFADSLPPAGGWELEIKTDSSIFPGLTHVAITAREPRAGAAYTLHQLVRLAEPPADRIGADDEAVSNATSSRRTQPRRRRMTAPRRGFTLIELVLGLVLTGLLAAALFAFLWNLESKRARLTAAAEARAGVTVFFEQLDNDLATTLAGGGGLPGGVVGTSSSVRVLSRGVTAPLGVGALAAAPREANAGSSADAPAPARPELGDLRGCEFDFDSTRGVVTGRRFVGPPAAALTGEMSPVVAGVTRVRFRYFDRGAWRDSFDSAALGRLPAALEVAVWLGAAPAEVEDGEPSEAAALPAPDRVRVIVIPDAGAAPEGEP